MKVRGRNNRDRNRPPPQGEGVLPVVAYTGTSARRDSFSRLQVYQRVGVTLVKVYEKVGKSVISVVRRFTGAFYGCENVEKLWFCGLFIF